MKYLPILISALFLLTVSSCSPGATSDQDSVVSSQAVAKKETVLVDLTDIPVFDGEFSGESEEFSFEDIDDAGSPDEIADSEGSSNPAAVMRILLEDEFDQFNQENWTVMEEKTWREVPDRVMTEDGKLVIHADITDRNTLFHSKPLKISGGEILRIKRRSLVEPGNKYANMSFMVYGTSTDFMTVTKETVINQIANVQYLDFQYDKGRYPITTGVLVSVPGYKDSGEYATWEPMFGQWLDEELEINTGTGSIRFTVNGHETELQGDPVVDPYVRVYMNAYGWHTGHKVTIENIEVSAASSTVLPEGAMVEKELLAVTVEPLDSSVEFSTAGGVKVKVPGQVSSEPEPLKVESVILEDEKRFGAVEISLGDLREIDGGIRITLPIPEGIIPSGENPADYLFPVYYNTATGNWIPEPCMYTDEGIEIVSDHLSTFALELGMGITMEQLDINVKDRAEAVEAAWGAMNTGLSFMGQGQSFASLVKETPFLDVLGNSLEKVGVSFTFINIARDMSAGNDREAGLAAVKYIAEWTLGKFATFGTQLAGVGSFFIDYSLNALAEGAFSAQEEAFKAAYRRYYAQEGMSTHDWYVKIKEILTSGASPENARYILDQTIENYVKKIWSDEAAFEGYLADIRGHGWTGDAGLNDVIKRKLEEDYKAVLYRTIDEPLEMALDWIETQVFRQQYREAARVRDFLNRDVVFWIDIFNDKRADEYDVALLRNGVPIMVIPPSKTGACDFWADMPLERVYSDNAPTHILFQGIIHHEDAEGEEELIPFSHKRPILWDSLRQNFQFTLERPEIEEPAEEEVEEPEEEVSEEEEPEEEISSDDIIGPFQIALNSDDPEEIKAQYRLIGSNLEVDKRFAAIGVDRRTMEVTLPSGEIYTLVYEKSEGSPPDSSIITYTTVTWKIEGLGRHGTFKEYWKDDKTVKEQAFYVRGELYGDFREYWEDGSVKVEGIYEHGKRIGVWTYYQENGQLASRGSYDSDNRKHGSWEDREIYTSIFINETFAMIYDHGRLIDDSARDAIYEKRRLETEREMNAD